MSYPPSEYAYGQTSVPPRSSSLTTVGKVLFFVGLVLSIITLIVGIWGVTRTVDIANRMASDAVSVQDTATMPLESDHVRIIMAETGTNPTCTVTGPEGGDVPVVRDSAFDGTSTDGLSFVGTFTAAQSGDHTVTCDAPAEVSPALGVGDAVGPAAAGIAFLALFPLGLLTLLGLILWLVGRNRDKKAQLAGPYGYSTSTGSAYQDAPGQGYGQPPYGSQPRPEDTPSSGEWSSSPPPPPSGSPYRSPSEERHRGDESDPRDPRQDGR